MDLGVSISQFLANVSVNDERAVAVAERLAKRK
jgi:hypothetical protein